MLFAFLLVPILVAQYRRFGALSLARLLGAAAASVYVVALVAYTLLPLPPVAEVCADGTRGGILQLHPFFAVTDIAHLIGRWGLVSNQVVVAVLQVVMNVVLFIPLGLLLRGFARRSVLTSTLAGLAVSLLIEVTQYTGDWGLYPCGYRIADVDDLMTNTLGALIGALLAARVLHWVPTAADLSQRPARPVSGLRRLLGMLADLVMFQVIELLVAIAWVVVDELLSAPTAAHTDVTDPSLLVVGALLAGLVVFGLPALVGSGASLGQRLVSIAPMWAAADGSVHRGTVGRRLARAGAVGGVLTAGIVVPTLLAALGSVVAPVLLGLVWIGWLTAALVTALLGDHRGLSGYVSGARMVDARPVGVVLAPIA